MEKLVLGLPALWADHHVLKARDALASLDGVEDVYASSAWKQVLVSYDSSRTDPASIEKALAEAGYPVGEGEVTMIAQAGKQRRDPQWADMSLRMTETNMIDLEMSGEFRKY